MIAPLPTRSDLLQNIASRIDTLSSTCQAFKEVAAKDPPAAGADEAFFTALHLGSRLQRFTKRATTREIEDIAKLHDIRRKSASLAFQAASLPRDVLRIVLLKEQSKWGVRTTQRSGRNCNQIGLSVSRFKTCAVAHTEIEHSEGIHQSRVFVSAPGLTTGLSSALAPQMLEFDMRFLRDDPLASYQRVEGWTPHAFELVNANLGRIDQLKEAKQAAQRFIAETEDTRRKNAALSKIERLSF